jgi:hypothetical protein
MTDEELHYIEDSKKRKLFYRFTPAAFASNFVPLIVVLHGEEAEAPHFEYKMWNVLTPLGDVAGEMSGTVWLGEKDDFYVRDLLQELIGKIADEYECEDHIYLYGSGMGGYGAIMHGILSKANTVYARSPRIRLNEIDTQENDLCNLLNATDTFPLFYLCDNPGAEYVRTYDASRVNRKDDDVYLFVLMVS